MKKLFFFLLLLLLVIPVSSCKDDDDDDNQTKSEILGKWFSYRDKYDDETEWEYYDDQECRSYVVFNENGTFTAMDFYGDDCEEYSSAGTWSVSGNKITISTKYQSETYTNSGEILTLDANDLKMRLKDEDGDTYVTEMKRKIN